ncbi:unnamed protein product (macronuclear) [Paramecium tetraurelia]|uniref:Uncharacterized protein n=1 Tax=Paramecium tetraurelia TaxID=5888 RepID=A0E8F2_PARTE|nr:uncharacterized protein GSPATT00024298001 [Paramecium tetraurelia]CAK91569.1 unnamed protein product [Paramecium tetraurelia]|eukprot:XP_001458966.1 hypothetical protein (macronuclear) [Paramecium tetraurelia strain d4-2]
MKAISIQGNISIEDLSNQRINLDTQLKHSDDQYVRNILPLRIQNFKIKRLEWKDFIGKPNDESPWIAHCYWNNSYEYYFTQDREQANYREQSQLRLPRIPLQQINQVNQLNVKTETARTTVLIKSKDCLHQPLVHHLKELSTEVIQVLLLENNPQAFKKSNYM